MSNESDHVYLSLAEGHEDGDARWAFGTGFEDPLHGVSIEPPPGVDLGALAASCLELADDALISAQRLGEWCTRAPELEEELALANIGLDLLGQARLLYSRVGQVDGTGRGEDAYAYFRDPAEFRNVRLAELPNGDFAFSMARLLAFGAWRLAVFERLAGSPDPVLAAVAAKGVKELTYHRQYAAEWTVRLGDGTDESHRRMQRGLDEVAPYLPELFDSCGSPEAHDEILAVLREVTAAAGLILPLTESTPGSAPLGRAGRHTGHLEPLLAQLQGLARAHPEATW
ncbi:MAG TPA: 1,2-phenylacetyl-CoA epoxidase subunit PaaC [Actinocrinis sp.]|uniref:1,2-phenylacetyl-CoA epoxidase subunit PaaC n=1 Tax=Actinocrinis sp. TaxID=1920516 RepID=UPI002DDD87F3|nr:1,2-phenylacetyl-CoA epoxidase subunit PaaC [Actinocrinis sp.]HEV2344032.1 1,2-phenylacetyl-CoA epoxidase subunit PaaC [Actinocrinis sp.]